MRIDLAIVRSVLRGRPRRVRLLGLPDRCDVRDDAELELWLVVVGMFARERTECGDVLLQLERAGPGQVLDCLAGELGAARNMTVVLASGLGESDRGQHRERCKQHRNDRDACAHTHGAGSRSHRGHSTWRASGSRPVSPQARARCQSRATALFTSHGYLVVPGSPLKGWTGSLLHDRTRTAGSTRCCWRAQNWHARPQLLEPS